MRTGNENLSPVNPGFMPRLSSNTGNRGIHNPALMQSRGGTYPIAGDATAHRLFMARWSNYVIDQHLASYYAAFTPAQHIARNMLLQATNVALV